MRQFIVAAALALVLTTHLACQDGGQSPSTSESQAYRILRGIHTIRPDGSDLTLLHEADAGLF